MIYFTSGEKKEKKHRETRFSIAMNQHRPLCPRYFLPRSVRHRRDKNRGIQFSNGVYTSGEHGSVPLSAEPTLVNRIFLHIWRNACIEEEEEEKEEEEEEQDGG